MAYTFARRFKEIARLAQYAHQRPDKKGLGNTEIEETVKSDDNDHAAENCPQETLNGFFGAYLRDEKSFPEVFPYGIGTDITCPERQEKNEGKKGIQFFEIVHGKKGENDKDATEEKDGSPLQELFVYAFFSTAALHKPEDQIEKRCGKKPKGVKEVMFGVQRYEAQYGEKDKKPDPFDIGHGGNLIEGNCGNCGKEDIEP